MAATAKKVVSLDLVKLVDELGTVKGQIAALKSLDWKAIALRLAPSRQLIAGNTTYKPRTTVRLVARKTGGTAQ